MRGARDDVEDARRSKSRAKQQHWQERQDRSRENREEIEQLQLRCADLRRDLETIADSSEANTSTEHQYTKFSELPISQRTMMGLERGRYTTLTPIQRDTLHLALAGCDVLGAAKTGSGKTLCFVIPVLESLYREHWSADMGVGALLLSPTRELALQIFKVMQLVGHKHVHSAALLTGGRDVQEERKRLHAISIIVGTPGRILHHLQDDAELVLDNMQLFCMDEADRLLDMGFREAITNILHYLPPQRQTLLFSATQTTDVQMLAQMSLKNPRYVSTQAITASPTPTTLCQNFVVLDLHRKLDALLMFLKRHPNDKIVVFVSTCNQVKFMYLAFSKILKKMRIPSMCLTSKMKQFRREEVFLTFCRCKSAVLFCTDVASRGLDFPLVHWVVQYDCPESAQTYIHRAGRTARAGARGVSLLFLTPREVPMLSYLNHKHVPLREIAIKPDYMTSSQEIFVALVVQGLKYEAQKAFIAYLRSVYFASNKNVFEVASIDVDAFAKSLGLLVVPDMSELSNLQRSAKNLPWDVVNFIAQRSTEKSGLTRKEKHLQATDMYRVMEQKQRFANKNGALSGDAEEVGDASQSKMATSDEDDDDDGFLVKKAAASSVLSSSSAAKDTQRGSANGASMHLTVDERLAGLSKNKRRKLIENPDLRVRDLGLNEHIFFKDDEDEEDGDEGQRGATARRKRSTAAKNAAADSEDDDNEAEEQTRVAQLMKGAVVHRNDDDGSDDDSESGADETDFASKLQSRMQAIKPDDLERAKKMRRLRRLQRQGRVSRKSTIDDSGVTTKNGGPRPAQSGDDSDNDYDVGDSDGDASSTGSLSRLLKAAKGELYSDDDENDDGEREEDYEASKPTRKRGHAETAYHGIDSSEDNDSDAEEREEVVVKPPQRKKQKSKR